VGIRVAPWKLIVNHETWNFSMKEFSVGNTSLTRMYPKTRVARFELVRMHDDDDIGKHVRNQKVFS
jgi:hypothetical protein